MTSRDQELDNVMRELRRDDPYIEKPDEMRVDIGGGCFLDRERVCGPDCTAFTDEHAPTAAERCTVLTGINTGVELLGELIKLRRPARPPPPSPPSIPPPDPMGRPFTSGALPQGSWK